MTAKFKYDTVRAGLQFGWSFEEDEDANDMTNFKRAAVKRKEGRTYELDVYGPDNRHTHRLFLHADGRITMRTVPKEESASA